MPWAEGRSRILLSRSVLRWSVRTVDAGAWLARCPGRVEYLRGTRDRLVPEASVQRVAALTSAWVVRVAGPHPLLQAARAAVSGFTAGCSAAEQQDDADARRVT